MSEIMKLTTRPIRETAPPDWTVDCNNCDHCGNGNEYKRTNPRPPAGFDVGQDSYIWCNRNKQKAISYCGDQESCETCPDGEKWEYSQQPPRPFDTGEDSYVWCNKHQCKLNNHNRPCNDHTKYQYQNGEPVGQVRAQKLTIKDEKTGHIDGAGLIFDAPTAWPAADSLTGLQVCDMCTHWRRGDSEDDNENEKEYCLLPPGIELCQPHNSPCQQYEHAGEEQAMIAVAGVVQKIDKNYHLTDLGNSDRFADRYKDRVRYCHEWGKWLSWDGRKWLVDDTGSIERGGKEVVRDLYTEALTIDDLDRRKKMIGFALACESDHRIKAMISLAESDLRLVVKPTMLDRHPLKLNVLNGTLDLGDMELKPHDREEYHSKICNVEYEAAATCPTWDTCLETWFADNQDDIKFVQKAAGYSLTGDISEHCLFILYGTGRNGKSTFLNTIAAILNDYSLNTPAETLLVKTHDGIPNDLARLKGARFVTAVEAEAGRRLAEAMVKQSTGGDKISARFMRAEWFDYTPEYKIWLATNHKPVVKGTDDAIWERIRLIPFTTTIPEEKRDKRLDEKLKAEGPGILKWMLEGYRLWCLEGLKPSQNVRAATDDYKKEMDDLGEFIEERCVLEGDVYNKNLYASYCDYCDVEGLKPATQKFFTARMRERGFVNHPTKKGKIWFGLSIKDQPSLGDG